MVEAKKPQLGGLPPKFCFILNPYPHMRVSRCPDCGHKTGQRKIPLLIHVQTRHLIALNYTCRYCRDCDLLIAHKHAIEHLLTEMFRQHEPAVVGNDYLILGTVEKAIWREGLHRQKAVAEILPHVSHFAEHYTELRVTRPGWYKADEEPPVLEPPPSREWVKSKPRGHRS